MNKPHVYAAVALSGCGFVVLDGQIAFEQRPDLYHHAIEAGGFLDAHARQAIAGWPGLARCTLRLLGIDRDLLLLTRRFDDTLATRIEHVIGRRVINIVPVDGATFWEVADATTRVRVERATERGIWRKTNGNRHANGLVNGHANGRANSHVSGAPVPSTRPIEVRTAEPARYQLCSGCEHMAVGGNCKAASESGEQRPNPREARRCIAFVPIFSALDGRRGRDLWPELITTGA